MYTQNFNANGMRRGTSEQPQALVCLWRRTEPELVFMRAQRLVMDVLCAQDRHPSYKHARQSSIWNLGLA